jgi:Rrf2 family protein
MGMGQPMLITQKNQYAIRAIYELARRHNQGPIKGAEIAAVQKIPPRFLEVIMVQLKRSGFVASKRGYHGGYVLMRPPNNISVGDILRNMETVESLHCVSCIAKDDCDLKGDCSFLPMWTKAHKAMLDVFDNTTIQNLLDDNDH